MEWVKCFAGITHCMQVSLRTWWTCYWLISTCSFLATRLQLVNIFAIQLVLSQLSRVVLYVVLPLSPSGLAFPDPVPISCCSYLHFRIEQNPQPTDAYRQSSTFVIIRDPPCNFHYKIAAVKLGNMVRFRALLCHES